MASIRDLDPLQRPPESIKAIYKLYNKLANKALDADPNVLDFTRGLNLEQLTKVLEVSTIPQDEVYGSCLRLENQESLNAGSVHQSVSVYEHSDVPGLQIVPSLIPQQTQIDLVSRLMHEILADPRHKTNVHIHHKLPYHISNAKHSSMQAELQSQAGKSFQGCSSFFNASPESHEQFMPVNPAMHKPITVSQFLCKKLRWLTLGGQYDWTKKVYPPEDHPDFPKSIATFIRDLFPGMEPEAAIVNLYSPGDTLSIHRDVSEDSAKGLVSISLGCDGIFVVGVEQEGEDILKHVAVRLRSGDAVYMSGLSRFAWHGVPRIIPDTCPEWLKGWPAESTVAPFARREAGEYEAWRGWMATKRINLNVRQMKD